MSVCCYTGRKLSSTAVLAVMLLSGHLVIFHRVFQPRLHTHRESPTVCAVHTNGFRTEFVSKLSFVNEFITSLP